MDKFNVNVSKSTRIRSELNGEIATYKMRQFNYTPPTGLLTSVSHINEYLTTLINGLSHNGIHGFLQVHTQTTGLPLSTGKIPIQSYIQLELQNQILVDYEGVKQSIINDPDQLNIYTFHVQVFEKIKN
jgi:hypothetical protein